MDRNIHYTSIEANNISTFHVEACEDVVENNVSCTWILSEFKEELL